MNINNVIFGADTPPPPSPSQSNSTSAPPPKPAKNDTSSAPPPTTSPPPPASSPPPAVAPPPQSPPPPDNNSSPPPSPPKDSPSPPPEKSPSPKKSPSPPSDKSPPAPPPEKGSPPAPATIAPPPTNSTVVVSPPPPPTPLGTVAPPAPVRSSPTPVNSPPANVSKSSPPPQPSFEGTGDVAPPTSSSPSPSSSSSMNVGAIAVVSIIGVGIVAAIIICMVCAARKKKKRQYYADDPATKGEYYNGSNWNTGQNLRPLPGVVGTPGVWTGQSQALGGNSGSDSGAFSGQYPTSSPNMALSNQSSFSYEELAQATNGFAQENVLGQGGFGYVHKGVLPSGKEVAVKSLKAGSGQGEREFQAEVEIISRVHHRHLVSLVGYCIADGQRMLVYEFVPNKTMEFHLHGKGQATMDWPTRLRIALGAAKGLGYLHEDCHPRIIHRDIKAANILLDDNFEAMVADFGLAKLTSENFTHVSTRVMGTFGYMAPEYASSGKLSDKSDVFSYGVMLLELITGRRPIDLTNPAMEDSLVDWARPLLGSVLESGNYGELVDPRLLNNFDPNEMNRMIACAAASIRHSARKRPKMTQIVRSLEEDQSSLDDTAIKQGQTLETATYNTTAYNADMMKFKKMVMMGGDYGSSEFEHTSEYVHNPSTSSSEMSSREFPNSGPQVKKL